MHQVGCTNLTSSRVTSNVRFFSFSRIIGYPSLARGYSRFPYWRLLPSLQPRRCWPAAPLPQWTRNSAIPWKKQGFCCLRRASDDRSAPAVPTDHLPSPAVNAARCSETPPIGASAPAPGPRRQSHRHGLSAHHARGPPADYAKIISPAGRRPAAQNVHPAIPPGTVANVPRRSSITSRRHEKKQPPPRPQLPKKLRKLTLPIPRPGTPARDAIRSAAPAAARQLQVLPRALPPEGSELQRQRLAWESADGRIQLERPARADAESSLFGDRHPWIFVIVAEYGPTPDVCQRLQRRW